MPRYLDDSSAWALATANAGLAHAQADLFCRLNPHCELDDLRSEAMLALFTAARYFKPRGLNETCTAGFSTYAVVSIKRRLFTFCAKATRYRQCLPDEDDDQADKLLAAPECEPALDLREEERVERDFLSECTDELPEPSRTAVRLWLGLDGTPWTIDAIAWQLDCRRSVVMELLTQATQAVSHQV